MIAFEEYLLTKGYRRFKLFRVSEDDFKLVLANNGDYISTMKTVQYYWIKTDKTEFTANEFQKQFVIIIGVSTGLTPTLLFPRLNVTLEITEKNFCKLHNSKKEGREDKIIKLGSDFDVTNVRLLSEFSFDEILDVVENNPTKKFYIPIKNINNGKTIN